MKVVKALLLVVMFYSCREADKNQMVLIDFATALNNDLPAEQILLTYVDAEEVYKPELVKLIGLYKKEVSATNVAYKVYSYTKARRNGVGYDIDIAKNQDVYFISYKDGFVIPVLMTENNTIGSLFVLKKGDRRYFL